MLPALRSRGAQRSTVAIALVALVSLAAACGSSSSRATSTTTTPDRSGVAAYAHAGPYAVGYTTLHLSDRDVAVWYPADPSAVAGMTKATYDQTTPLPDNLKGLVPAQYNTVVTMDAYANAPASTKGPFPVVLFSHGAGGYRLVNSALDVGIASWGFVVASTDYLERGLAAQVSGGAKQTGEPTKADQEAAAARDTRLMLATLDLVAQESARSGSPMHDAAETKHVAAVGHSAGGGTAFDALSDPRIKVAIGWAPVPPIGTPVDKPTMIIGALGDIALTPAALTKTYTSFPTPKRFVEIGGAGHNTFTDVCTVIRGGGGLVSFAQKNHLVSPDLLKLAVNGCSTTDLAPAAFWPVVQHFTVAEIRSVLGIDRQPVGLGAGVTRAFPGITVQYRQAS